MTPSLKALGLALAAVFAVSAVAATAASAQQGTLTSDGPVTLVGEEIALNTITAFGLTAKCPGSTGTGHKYSETPHQLIPSGATTFTLTPHIKQANHNCQLNPGGFPATTDFNGCDYVAHLGETTGGVADTYGGTIDIVCPPGKEIVWTLFTNTTDETNNKPFCVLDVKPQIGLAGSHVTDNTNGTLNLAGLVSGIHISKTSVSHPLLCPNQTTNTAQLHSSGIVRGLNSSGASTAIALSHP